MRYAIAVAICLVAAVLFDWPGLVFGILVGFGVVMLGNRRISIDHSQPFFESAQPASLQDARFFELFGYLCKIDGVVSRNEILGVELIFDQLNFTSEERQQAVDSFNHGKSPQFDFESTLQVVRQLHFPLGSAEKLLHLMNVVVANADGSGLIAEERHLLFRIGEAFGLSVRQIGAILLLNQDEYIFSGGQQQENDYSRSDAPREESPKSTLRRAYETLDIDSNATAREASKSYRKLRSKYHPDKLPKHAPENERQAAARKFDEIQRAWDIVRVHFNV